MIFAPVRLGETSLNAEAVAADKKSCKRFGPCGVGKEALFLNSYFIDRRYYVAFSSVRRVFKRVAMSQGGFSGQGVFGAIPYLVVQYDGGKEKQCTFKREEDVDAMLAYIGKVHPEIPTLSVGGEQRLEQKAKEEAARYLSELTSDAQSAKEELEKAQKFLSGYPELTDRLSKAARAKRVNQHTNPAYRWVALAIVLAGAAALVYGIISWRNGGDFGMFLPSSALRRSSSFPARTCCPRRRTTKRPSPAPGKRHRPTLPTSCRTIFRCRRAMRTLSCSRA